MRRHASLRRRHAVSRLRVSWWRSRVPTVCLRLPVRRLNSRQETGLGETSRRARLQLWVGRSGVTTAGWHRIAAGHWHAPRQRPSRKSGLGVALWWERRVSAAGRRAHTGRRRSHTSRRRTPRRLVRGGRGGSVRGSCVRDGDRRGRRQRPPVGRIVKHKIAQQVSRGTRRHRRRRRRGRGRGRGSGCGRGRIVNVNQVRRRRGGGRGCRCRHNGRRWWPRTGRRRRGGRWARRRLRRHVDIGRPEFDFLIGELDHLSGHVDLCHPHTVHREDHVARLDAAALVCRVPRVHLVDNHLP